MNVRRRKSEGKFVSYSDSFSFWGIYQSLNKKWQVCILLNLHFPFLRLYISFESLVKPLLLEIKIDLQISAAVFSCFSLFIFFFDINYPLI